MQITDEIVDVAARAIFDARPHRHPDGRTPAWDAQPANIRKAFLNDARAALNTALAVAPAPADAEVERALDVLARVPGYKNATDAIRDTIRRLAAERAAALARAERAEAMLREAARALEPFDEMLGEDEDPHPDQMTITCTWGPTTYYALTVGDLRRARLAAATAAPTEGGADA